MQSDSGSSTPVSTSRLSADPISGENHADFVEKLFDFGMGEDDDDNDDDANDEDVGGDNDVDEKMSVENSIDFGDSGVENSMVESSGGAGGGVSSGDTGSDLGSSEEYTSPATATAVTDNPWAMKSEGCSTQSYTVGNRSSQFHNDAMMF